jgi:3-phenylpropionate/cinnamic acid dioxygenase small subunit
MSTLSDKLRKDSVVLEAAEETSGAQRIDQEHAGRGARYKGELPRLDAVAITPELAPLYCSVQQFLAQQAEMLDRKQWRAYIDLFAADGLYWMPANAEQTSWTDEPSIFAEDRLLMEVRMGRLTHPNAWSQAPVWMTSHVVGSVVLEQVEGSRMVVRSRFNVTELRRDTMRNFVGTYRHVLNVSGGEIQIQHQRVDLVNGAAPFDYVIQAWV